MGGAVGRAPTKARPFCLVGTASFVTPDRAVLGGGLNQQSQACLAPDTHHTRRCARGRWHPPRPRTWGGTEGYHDASSPESDTYHRSGGGLLGRENAPQRCRTGPLYDACRGAP